MSPTSYPQEELPFPHTAMSHLVLAHIMMSGGETFGHMEPKFPASLGNTVPAFLEAEVHRGMQKET